MNIPEKMTELGKIHKIHSRAASKMSRLYSIRMITPVISQKFDRIPWHFNWRALYFTEIQQIIKMTHIVFHWK